MRLSTGTTGSGPAYVSGMNPPQRWCGSTYVIEPSPAVADRSMPTTPVVRVRRPPPTRELCLNAP